MILVLCLSSGKSFSLRASPQLLRLSSQFRPQSSQISLRLLDSYPKLTLIPTRNFGRGIKTSKFADRRTPTDPPFSKFVLVFSAVLLTVFLMDADNLQKLGINVKPFLQVFHGLPYIKKRVATTSSLDMALEENKEDIHQFMKEKAALRALEEAQTDPEICAILAGQQVTPQDPEEFEVKKKFVERIQQVLGKTNLKAETIDSGFVESAIEEDDERNKGFRNRTIIKYENRIRHFSTPDKVFRYFATYKVATDDKGHYEPMMTPEDFLRSITPGMKQPENLGLDHYILLNGQEIDKLSPQLGVQENSIFHQLGSGGLITFSDYIFLLTVLSTSRRHFEIAFKMFDLNGDGNVDAREFEVVANLMKSQSSMGIRHRDHQNTGSTFKGINSGLISFFFGSDKSGTLTVEKFLDFQRCLQNEILQLEFNRKLRETRKVDANKKIDYGHMKISEKDFADLLITYAGFSSEKKSKMLKRVKKVYGGENETGVSLQDYLNFYQVLYSINDIDTALTFYTIAGAPIERPTMKHVAQTVAGVKVIWIRK